MPKTRVLPLGLALVALTSFSFAAPSASMPFDTFAQQLTTMMTGPLFKMLAVVMLLMGGALAVVKCTPMPALTGIAGAAFLSWGPSVIQTMTGISAEAPVSDLSGRSALRPSAPPATGSPGPDPFGQLQQTVSTFFESVAPEVWALAAAAVAGIALLVVGLRVAHRRKARALLEKTHGKAHRQALRIFKDLRMQVKAAQGRFADNTAEHQRIVRVLTAMAQEATAATNIQYWLANRATLDRWTQEAREVVSITPA